MKWHIINSVSLEKPAFGSPCNGCGLCCIEQVCALGVELGDDQNCKALMPVGDGSYRCSLVEDPYRFLQPERLLTWRKIDALSEGKGEQALKGMYADMLGAGRGCDSDDEVTELR